MLLPKPEIGLVMEAVERQVPTFVPAVPPLYERIVAEAQRRGVSIHGIRYGLSGAMPLPAELVERWEAATGGLLVEGYGLTETSPVVVGNPMTTDRRPGSIGVPFPDVEVRVADPEDLDREVPLGERGELLVRGPQVFDGYRGMPAETAAAFHDGWFRTGDVVTMDERGFITIVDRIKEIIITGGFNVYPSEVEAVLRAHDGVLDVAVVGAAAREWQRGGRRGGRARRGRRDRARRPGRPREGVAHRLQGAATLRRRRAAAGQRDGQGRAPRGGYGPSRAVR